MDFVCRISIPDNELAVLRSRHQMTAIGRPVHGIDFGQMSFEHTARLHPNPWQLFCVAQSYLGY